MIVDYKNKEIKIGDKVKIVDDVPTSDGMLYEGNVVKIDEFNLIDKKIRVTDLLGKIWWIEPNKVSVSFK